MEALRKLYIVLGLDFDESKFAKALTAERLLAKGAQFAVDAFRALITETVSSVTQLAEFGAAMDDARARTGASVEALQFWGYAAKLSGSDAETMFSALAKLSITMSAARDGSKEAAAGFARLGVRVKGTDGELRSTDEVMRELVGALGRIENPTERGAAAFAVLGKQAVALAPLLEDGAQGLDLLTDQFVGLGLAIDEEGVAAANRFADSLDILREVGLSFRRDFAQPVIAELQPVIDEFFVWVQVNRAVIRTRIAEYARLLTRGVIGLGKALGVTIKAVRTFVEQWRLVAVLLGSVGVAAILLNTSALSANAAAATVAGLAALRAGLMSAAAWVGATAPVLLLAAALAFVALAAEDVYYFLTGGDSVIGELGPKWTAFLHEWSKPIPGEAPIMTAIRELVGDVADLEGRALPKLRNAWWLNVLNPLAAVVDQVDSLRRNWDQVAAALEKVRDVLRVVVPGFRAAEAALEPENRARIADFLKPLGPAYAGEFNPSTLPPAGSTSTTSQVIAPRLEANITLQVPPSAAPESFGVLVTDQLDSWWDTKVRELAATPAGE